MTTARDTRARKSTTAAGGEFKGKKPSNDPGQAIERSHAFASVGGSQSEPFNRVILREALATVWVPANEEDGQTNRIQAVMAALKGVMPRDEIDGMLAAQVVAMHFGAMECLRRSMQPDQPSDIASKLRRDGANLARTMVEMLDALDRKRGKRPQVVRVERVVVQDGGQAIVGNVSQAPDFVPQSAALEAAPTGPIRDLSKPAHPVSAASGGGGET